MKLGIRIYMENVDDHTNITSLSEILTGSLEACDENQTIETMKNLIVTNIFKLSSMNHQFIRLSGRSCELSDECKSLASYEIKDQDELICVFHSDSCLQEKLALSKLTTLTDVCHSIAQLKNANSKVTNDIKTINEVKQYKYVGNFVVNAGKPKFSIEEITVSTPAIEIIDEFRIDENLTPIQDLFNDKIDYADCSTFDKIQTLNEIMFLTVEKYGDNFEETNVKIVKKLLLFADNYLILNRNLKRLRRLLNDEVSQMPQLQESEDIIMNQFQHLSNGKVDFAPSFHHSTLLSTRESIIIVKKFIPSIISKWEFNLLYRGSRDGKNAATFHRLCDNQGPTLVVIKNAAGHIFGGFASVSWNQSNTYIADTNAFLFTLSNPHNIVPTKFQSNNNNAVYCHPSYGPTFGGGHDLRIDSNISACSFSFSTYLDSTGHGSLVFTGGQNSDVVDMEVWQCVPQECCAFDKSIILDRDLSGWLRLMIPGENIPISLYRSSRHGKKAKSFHARCDGKGATVTIVKDTNGYIFGGYTSASWNAAIDSYYNDTQAFLFTLKNPRGIRPTKFTSNGNGYGIYCRPSYGPTFGGGHDICIADGHGQTNIGFPHGYTDTSGYGYQIFNGSNHMTPQEVEVWKV